MPEKKEGIAKSLFKKYKTQESVRQGYLSFLNRKTFAEYDRLQKKYPDNKYFKDSTKRAVVINVIDDRMKKKYDKKFKPLLTWWQKAKGIPYSRSSRKLSQSSYKIANKEYKEIDTLK